MILFTLFTLNTFNVSSSLNLNVKSMSFNVNKDSLWLSFPLKKTCFKELAKKIPETHRLAKCKVFEEDNNDYRLFFNIFQVKTPFFSGNRLEIVTLIKNIENNKISFVVLDCYSDAMTWDPINNIQKANSIIKKNINNFDYNVVVKQILRKQTNENRTIEIKEKIFNLKSKKSVIKKKPLTEFSIEPNHICYFNNHPIGYILGFDKKQIDKNVIFLKDIRLYNNIYTKFIKELEYVFIYPQPMNFKIYLNKET